MNNEALQQTILSWFPDPEFPQPQFTEEGSQFLNLSTEPEQLHELMHLLKNNPETHFDYLFCLTGVDYGKELGVVYHLESTVHRHIMVVKVQTADRENPILDSVQDLWATANFHEREVFDFFGIKFKNHPNLKRLFLTDEWEGYPLRKDYVDETNMVVK
ncbi:NADH-quinone oxidoreductase subunit C [Salinimicrobium sediminis]|uniref:NADH-quinone oxidoreductase subunit C n=1 Tax=Salinimicrobium sediminis TaxID=1343891 RepID=A0A285X875_9FLAO|nr:NADH-quinone oxidoreductase subunit C [Salinimicrobium sediminis]SOC81523.1 NADH-quinone oxidoreductase subunit C [Salinimicrobium sediminis]